MRKGEKERTTARTTRKTPKAPQSMRKYEKFDLPEKSFNSYKIEKLN